jgi:iron complex outermembrane receptor protein
MKVKLHSNSAARIVSSAAALLASYGSLAHAQEDAGSTKLDTVVVTGTRQTGLQAALSPAPIQILSAADLERASGNPDLIQTLASIVPSLTAQAFGGDMANQTMQAKLRGLSPNHVLVLIDGKRRHTTSNLAVLGGPYQGGAGVDLNFIPVSAIDHIEVLTEGAAAQYGSDAIAGVINIITKKKTSGGTVSATYGGYTDGGGTTGNVSGTAAFKPAPGAYLDLTGEVQNHGTSFRGGIDPRVIDPAKLSTYPDSNMPYADKYPYLNRIQGDAAVHQQTFAYSGGTIITDNISFYSFGTVGNKNAASFENYRLPDKISYTDPNSNSVSYLYPYGFSPKEAIEEFDYSETAGFKGMVADWNWDLGTSYGKDKIKLYTRGSGNASLYAATGATPIDFYDGNFSSSESATTLDLNRDFAVGLAAPLNVAFGVEYRNEKYGIGAGNPASYINGGAQSFPGYTPTDAGEHHRDNYAGYVDFATKPIDKLLVDLAGRYEHYSDFGSTTVGKLTSRYDFVPTFAIRGTISNGFRAPTLAEEFYSATNVGPTTAFVQLPPNAAAAQLLGLGTLQPEKSTSFSFGFVFTPIDNMTATLDLYQTSIKNRIVGSGTIYGTIDGASVSPVVTQAIVANGNQLDPDVVATGSTGVNIFTNGIDTKTQGADLAFNYLSKFSWARVNWGIAGTYNYTKITKVRDTPTELGGQPLFDATAKSDLTSASPKYVINLSSLLTNGPFSLNLVEQIYGPSSEAQSDFGDANGTPTYYTTKISVTPITNIDLAYQITKAFKLDLGADNVFDTYPDKINSNLINVYNAADDNTAVAIYPAFSPFGINGGYYYARASFKF